MTDDLLTTEQAAKRLGLAEQTLAQWRWLGKGPEFVKVGSRVRYPSDSLDRWLSTRRKLNDLRREVFVPLSLRRKVTDAIENARPGYSDQTLASAQAEAAIDALRPFMNELLADSPDQALPGPSDDGDGLENGGH